MDYAKPSLVVTVQTLVIPRLRVENYVIQAHILALLVVVKEGYSLGQWLQLWSEIQMTV
jgi:hypothetical protein